MKSNKDVAGSTSAWWSGKSRRSWTLGGAFLAAASGAAVALVLGALITVNAQAATPTPLYVSQTGVDSGSCTTRAPCASISYALTKASSGATINVSGTVVGTSTISTTVTITSWVGGPVGSRGILSASGKGRVLTVTSTGNASFVNLTIENGAGVSAGDGVENAGTVAITDTTISGNSSGSAVYNSGPMTVTNSTITGNSNGGIENAGSLTIVSSTIADNSGLGITTDTTLVTATVRATILANNSGGNCKPNSSTSYESFGYNLTSDATGTACGFTTSTDLAGKDPLLGPLANNGGPTETLIPATTSPAADVIPNPTTLGGFAVCPGADQRGVARPGQGNLKCSIGAVEVGSTSPTTTSVTVMPTTVKFGARVIYLVTVDPNAGVGTPTGKVSFTIGKLALCKAVLSGGVAACGATVAPVGADTVKATYSGGAGFLGSSGTAPLTVT